MALLGTSNVAVALTLAQRALDKAEQITLEQAVTAAKMDQHLLWCVKFAEESRSMESAWRKNLGERLDRQDRLMFGALASIIAILLAVVGFFLSHVIKVGL
jgi:CHASE3 domain sensor protein